MQNPCSDRDATAPSGRRSLGIEPMTCAPSAFQSGEGLIILEPGESFVATWGIEPS
jgi:aldose 1-epimerase